MDESSQKVVAVLEALSSAVDEFQSFGYNLYLETKAPSWIPSRNLMVSGKDYKHYGQKFDRAFTIVFTIECDEKKNRSLIFSILLTWNNTHWFTQSCVEYENMIDQISTETLWESGEYYATSTDMLIQIVQQASMELKESITYGSVAAQIAKIEQQQISK